MHSPTQRELFLVAVLFITLLTFSSTHISHQGVSRIDLSSIWHDIPSPPKFSGIPTLPSDMRLSWGKGKVPRTRIIAHAPGEILYIFLSIVLTFPRGWTIFDRMYIYNGTVYLVSDEPDTFPDRKYMTSAGINIDNDPEMVAARKPTDKDMRIISTSAARKLFGTGANRIQGVTVRAFDVQLVISIFLMLLLVARQRSQAIVSTLLPLLIPVQLYGMANSITHYYHWSAELIFGLWRTYSALDPSIPTSGKTELPPPRRLLFTHVDADHWRDYASMNQWVLRTALPSISMEFSDDWKDRAAMGVPFVFDRVVFADRAAAMSSEVYLRSQRTASVAFTLPGSPNWWNTFRDSVIQPTGLNASAGAGTQGIPVITYISRQDWGRRMLIQSDHEKLVEELYKLQDQYGYEVNVVSMDHLSRAEQLRLAGRTTVRATCLPSQSKWLTCQHRSCWGCTGMA